MGKLMKGANLLLKRNIILDGAKDKVKTKIPENLITLNTTTASTSPSKTPLKYAFLSKAITSFNIGNNSPTPISEFPSLTLTAQLKKLRDPLPKDKPIQK